MPLEDNEPRSDSETSLGEESENEHSAEDIDWTKAKRGTRLLLEAIGEDPADETLSDTWERRVPETLATLSQGLREEEKPELRTFPADTSELVVKTGIPVYSLCSHHLLPYTGTAHVAYKPRDEVVGLSKLPRYVRWQSRRLTMQEELTTDIAEGLSREVNAVGVLVQIEATHLCEAMRGVETRSTTTTRASVGDMDEREESRFRDAIERSQS